MKGAQQRIHNLFTPVEQRAGPLPPDRLVILRSLEGHLLRVRELRLGERLRDGDLWSDGVALHPVTLPWWQLWERTLTENHCKHYRVSA